MIYFKYILQFNKIIYQEYHLVKMNKKLLQRLKK